MKKFLLIVVVVIAGAGLWLATREAPMKTLEGVALQHADKLPLGYFGGKLFDKHCASCHDNPQMHAPTREALAGFSFDSIMVALTFGKMQPMAAHLSKAERGLIAIHLSGTDTGQYDWLEQQACTRPGTGETTRWVGNWGLGPGNRRFASPAVSAINRDNVNSLELAWALAFPKVTDMRSQPAIVAIPFTSGTRPVDCMRSTASPAASTTIPRWPAVSAAPSPCRVKVQRRDWCSPTPWALPMRPTRRRWRSTGKKT